MSMGGHDNRTAVSYLRAKWSDQGAKALYANFTDPAYQAVWEAYAMLIALATWEAQFRDPCTVTLRGDT